MKIVRVRIRRGDPALGEAQMVYPAGFNADEAQRRGIGHIAYSGHMGEGGDEEWTLIGLDDALADTYALDPDMEIVTTVTADAELETWRIRKNEPSEQVRDATRIQAIAAKQSARITLSSEDLEALDPDNPVLGINRPRKASDYVAKANAAAADIAVRRGP